MCLTLQTKSVTESFKTVFFTHLVNPSIPGKEQDVEGCTERHQLGQLDKRHLKCWSARVTKTLVFHVRRGTPHLLFDKVLCVSINWKSRKSLETMVLRRNAVSGGIANRVRQTFGEVELEKKDDRMDEELGEIISRPHLLLLRNKVSL